MFVSKRLFAFAGTLALMLAACGGGAATPTTAPPVVASTAAPTTAAATPASDAEVPVGATAAVSETAAPGAAVPAPAELVVDKTKLAKELNLYSWDGYFDTAVLADFKTEYGVKVNLETYDSNETMYNKFKAGGNPGYDIVVPSDYMVEIMAREGMLEKIDYANVPNIAYVDPGHRSLYFDPNNEYSIAHNWGTTGIAYDSAKVPSLTSWKEIFEPSAALKGKIGMLDDPREPMAAALRFLGFKGSTENMDELAKARDLLLTQKDSVASYKFSSDYKKDLVDGSVDVAMMYSNDAVIAAKDKPTIKYIIPEGVTSIWQDNLAIPTGVKSKYTAEVFINYMLRPAVAAKNANALGMSTSNLGVMQQNLVDPKLLADKNVYPDIASLEKAGTLEWLYRFQNQKITDGYQEAYDMVLTK